MTSPIDFETPENVRLAYHIAGMGTRFSAWLLDTFFVWIVTLLLAILLMLIAAMAGIVLKNLDPGQAGDSAVYYVWISLVVVLFQFGSFLYFMLCELFWHGRTVGKRRMNLQVVKADGFALDAGSIVLRNIFRLVDQLPLLWIVPVLSPRGQRFGDMAAGSIVVSTAHTKLGDLREALLARPASEARFRFDGATLARATPIDVRAVEELLNRWPQLGETQRDELLKIIAEPLARRLRAEPPEAQRRREFIEDFLAGIYRREAKRLG